MPKQYHIRGRTSREIAESLELAMERGRFAGQDTLPTIRALASDLAVSPTTVNAAFSILRRRGRIVGRKRGGSVIVPRTAFQTTVAIDSEPVGRDLSIASPDRAMLPSLRSALAQGSDTPRTYGDVRSSGPLYDVARAEFARDGIENENIGIASGATDAIDRALGALAGANDLIGLEDPGYPVFVALAHSLALRVVRIPVDQSGMTPDGLESAIRAGVKVIVTVPRAQNPTGASFDEKRARALKRILAHAPDVAVLEDDYLAMVVDTPLYSITAGRRRWLHVRSLAKSLGPDLRVAIFTGDQLTVSRIVERQRISCGWVSHLLQGAAAQLLRSADTKRLVSHARKAYGERRAYFLRALAERGVPALGDTGFNVWIPVIDEAAAVRAAAGAGFTIDGGARYRDQSPPGVRVSITTLLAHEADTLADALAGAIRSTNVRP